MGLFNMVGTMWSIEGPTKHQEDGRSLDSPTARLLELRDQSSPALDTPADLALNLHYQLSDPHTFEIHHQLSWVSKLQVADRGTSWEFSVSIIMQVPIVSVCVYIHTYIYIYACIRYRYICIYTHKCICILYVGVYTWWSFNVCVT